MKTLLLAAIAAAVVLLAAPAMTGAQTIPIICPSGPGCMGFPAPPPVVVPGPTVIPTVCSSGPGCLSVPYTPAPMAYATPGYGYGGGYYATSRGITRIHDTIGVVQRVIWLPAEVAGAIRTAEGIWRLPPPQYPQPGPYPGR